MDNRGNTALSSAVMMFGGKYGVVECLISHGADVNTMNKDGISPLLCAVMFDKLDMVKLLVNNGADIHIKCKGGMTPYKSAGLGLNNGILEYFDEIYSESK